MEGLQARQSEVKKSDSVIEERSFDDSMYIIGKQLDTAQVPTELSPTETITADSEISELSDLASEIIPTATEPNQDGSVALEASTLVTQESQVGTIGSEEQIEIQAAVAEFTEDIESEMQSIESEFHLPPGEIESVRAEVGATSMLSKLANLWESHLHKTGLKIREYPTTEHNDAYKEKREALNKFEGEIPPEFLKEAREAATKVFEERGLFTLSKDDFNNYFVTEEEFDAGPRLRQANVGNCYLVAALHAMSKSPNFETICRASTKRLEDGAWEIKIPLLGDEGDIVTISQAEMRPQISSKELPEGESMETQEVLYPLAGKEGFRALEAAYTKHKFGKVDRYASNGGSSEEALLRLGGDNFYSWSFDSVSRDPKDRNNYVQKGLRSLEAIDQAYLDHFLESFNHETHIATVATKYDAGRARGMYRVAGTTKILIRNHAYSVSKVDAKNKLVTIANPWDTAVPITLTFDQFKDSFGRLDGVRINNGKLLSRMTNKANVV